MSKRRNLDGDFRKDPIVISPTNENQSRREFLRTCARNVSIAGLGVLAAAMLIRKPDDEVDHHCISEGICDGCRVFSGCVLPQALSAKQAGIGSTKQ